MAEENERRAADEVEIIEADTEVPRASVVRRSGTFESFQHRDYSLFWSGSLVSNMGSWMQNYALAIVVYSLRQSELDSGIVQFVAGVPVLFLALPAGLLADRMDKRQLLIWSQVVMLVQAVALGLLFNSGRLSSSDPLRSLVWIAALGLLGGVMSALMFPAWQSLLPDLVPRDTLLNAIALNSAQFQSARLLGPLAAAGLVLVGAGMGEIFYVNAASFVFVIAALWAIRPHPLAESQQNPHRGPTEGAWRTLTAGLRYAREHRPVGTLLISTAIMTIFGMPYMMLLPAFADKALGGGEVETAYLMAANGLGAVIGALAVASLKKSTNRERLIPFALLAFSLLLAAFSQSTTLGTAMLFSALAGAGILTVNSLANTSIQSAVPTQLRGRVMALFVMSFMGLMPISSLIFGPIGEVIGPARAILGGSIALATWAIVLLSNRWLLRPRQDTAA
ncbi:MAG TPA: MFS transporter [Coriobacteriia bacterium]|nr:MFS transporter [Coriobacteriia bacterium]